MVWVGAVVAHHNERSAWLNRLVEAVFSGGVAGLVANTLTHPIDTFKAHAQYLTVYFCF